MAWTDPSGHVYATGEVLAASTLNTYVKDNLIDLDRRTTITGATTATLETTTTSASYVNLATTGPAATVTIGSVGQCMCDVYSLLSNTTANQAALMGFAVSGATTVGAADAFAIQGASASAGLATRTDAAFLVSSLTAGSNTFTAKYRSSLSPNVANFQDRKIIVTPLGS